LKVGIIGCGLQGLRRAKAVIENDDELVIVSDLSRERADVLASQMKTTASYDWQDVVRSSDIETVIVCSPNSFHAQMTISALEKGKHVLCEKPLSTSARSAKDMVEAATKHERVLKCGFNHRHHLGVLQSKKWVNEGLIGQISFLRCRYGTAGRVGYDKEWRADPNISGGGELVDQGVHVIDLLRWFAGEFEETVGFTNRSFWDMAPVEDNAFALLRTTKGVVASMHVSWTQWRNLFSFEVFGKDGYVIVDGLGGSYGTEKAILGKRSFSEPFKEEIIDFRADDSSWKLEWREFIDSIKFKRQPIGNGIDGYEALKVVEAIYKSGKTGKVEKISEGSE
jgi:predicted dehydrogenase